MKHGCDERLPQLSSRFHLLHRSCAPHCCHHQPTRSYGIRVRIPSVCHTTANTIVGRPPNSPHQTTRVLSRRFRAFIFNKSSDGLVNALHPVVGLLDVIVTIPASISCTKQHLFQQAYGPKDTLQCICFFCPTPYASSVFCDSSDISIALVFPSAFEKRVHSSQPCSKFVMLYCRRMAFIHCPEQVKILPLPPAVTPGGGKFKIGEPVGRKVFPDRTPEDIHFPGAPPCGSDTSENNISRQVRISLPSPYVTHAPIAGSPPKRFPQFIDTWPSDDPLST